MKKTLILITGLLVIPIIAQTKSDKNNDRFQIIIDEVNKTIAKFESTDKHPIDIKLEKCIDKNSTSAGMRQCTRKNEKNWDNELNNVYLKLLSKLDTKGKENLKESQSTWIKYRTREFKNIETIYTAIYKQNGGGSIWITIETSRYLDITKARTLLLNSYLKDFDI